jgi:type IV pilus assembly protein PilP
MSAQLNFDRLRLLALVLGVGLAAGCVNRDKSDLESWVATTLKQPGGPIEPLPPIKPYQRYLYQSAEAKRRDPFASVFDTEPEKTEVATQQTDLQQQKYATEIAAHNREELEGFELDSLRMVGTLQNDAELWGIVRDVQGTVHRVQVGNYLGRNYGKILNIQEDRIDLREVVKDSEGRWEERQASLALSEERSNP